MALSDLVLGAGRMKTGESRTPTDIITFIEAPWGLDMKLYPVQRVILKAHYGMGLDDNPLGFPLDDPIPEDHPHYDPKWFDINPRAAQNTIEITNPLTIPDGADITLVDHTGAAIFFREGVHWSRQGSVADVTASIIQTLRDNVPDTFTVDDTDYGRIKVLSKGYSIEGNAADMQLTPCAGWRVGLPALETDQEGYEQHHHRFFAGEGGFYKYRIPISDWRRENARVYTEAGYLKYLHSENRCNVAEIIPGQERREMVLSIGRRSGKTLLTSCILAYETYKLLLKGNPQKHYGSSQSNVIQLISVATDKDQAGLLYQEAAGHFGKCDFFAAYMANATQSFATFQTPFDIERYGSYAENQKARYSVKVTFKSCVAKGLRGGANILVALDEVAHFTDKGQSSAESVYQAVEPSTRTFSPKDPNNATRSVGQNEGRIIMISSPLGKQGLFYKSYQIGYTSGRAAKNMLCIQAPTWEVNPTVPAGTFESSYLKDARVFDTEFGAKFTDRSSGWIEDKRDLLDCVTPSLRPKQKARPREPHFLGLDVGLVGDGSAVAIGHVDDNKNVVLDFIEQIKAGEGRFEHLERLEFTDVADWVYDLSRRFYISEGIFDQWAGIPMEQALAARGLKQLKSVFFTKPKSSEIFQNFKNMMYDKRLSLFNYPLKEGEEHCDYLKELLTLQAEYQSKYITVVAAPNTQGMHDDMSDALVRMVWVGSQHMGKMLAVGNYIGGQMGGKGPRRSSLTDRMATRQKALLGGSHPDRQVRRSKKNIMGMPVGATRGVNPRTRRG